MKLEFKVTLDKSKELELEYGKSIDLAFMSYNVAKQMEPNLPDVSCESVESDCDIVYTLSLGEVDLTDKDMNDIWGKMFGDDILNGIT